MAILYCSWKYNEREGGIVARWIRKKTPTGHATVVKETRRGRVGTRIWCMVGGWMGCRICVFQRVVADQPTPLTVSSRPLPRAMSAAAAFRNNNQKFNANAIPVAAKRMSIGRVPPPSPWRE